MRSVREFALGMIVTCTVSAGCELGEEEAILELAEAELPIEWVPDHETFPAPQEVGGEMKNGCAVRNDYYSTVTIGSGFWGDWAQCFDWCPEGQERSYAYSLRLRSEAAQGGGDDTALNGLKMDCYNKSDAVYRGFITSTVGPWGDWMSRQYCLQTSTPIRSGQMKIESPIGLGDDTAANRLSAQCLGGQWLQPDAHTSWGTWLGVVSCPSGTAVCGVQTRVESSQGWGDDTALNGVRFACCTF